MCDCGHYYDMNADIEHNIDRDMERFFVWARYVYWADVERQQYDDYEPKEGEPTTGLSFVLMAQWYAALWVSIEAWHESRMTDPAVEELLTDPAFESNVSLLRRFRNGVYHCQKTLTDERLIGFLAESSRTVPWANLVHLEFKRIVWEYAHASGYPEPIADRLASAIESAVGWIPSEIIEAMPYHAAREHREVTSMIMKSRDKSSPAAKDMLDAAEILLTVANCTTVKWSAQKRAMIDSLKRVAHGSKTSNDCSQREKEKRAAGNCQWGVRSVRPFSYGCGINIPVGTECRRSRSV